MSKDAVQSAQAATRTDVARVPADAGDAGYSKDLKARHVNMIAFLLACLAMMWNDPEVGRKTLLLIPLIAVLLVGGWFGIRRRVSSAADQELTELTG